MKNIKWSITVGRTQRQMYLAVFENQEIGLVISNQELKVKFSCFITLKYISFSVWG